MFLSFCFCAVASAVSQTQVNAIQADIRSMLTPPASDFNNRADYFGGTVRLPFHDAGSYDQNDGSGRPGACVNPFDPANGGLAEVINGIESVYQLHKSELSRADYWVLVATTSIEDAGGPKIPFYWGRIDCNGNYPPIGRLPDAEGNFTEVYNVFVKRMGLTVTDITALMGAHTLGRPQAENSGYEFFWNPSANLFTNQFYLVLQGSWKRVEQNFAFHATTHQWNTNPPPTGSNPFMMLNTDLSLVYDSIGYGGDGPCNTVPSSSCTTNNQTFGLVMQYANDQDFWFTDFSVGFQKLTSLGYPKLNPVG